VTASPHHTEYLKGLGATHVIDRHLDNSSLLNAIKKELADGCTQFAFDTISTPDTQRLAFELLAVGGRMLYTIPGSNVVESKDGKEVLLVKGTPFLPSNKELATSLYRHVVQFLEDGSIRVRVNYQWHVKFFSFNLLMCSQITLKFCPMDCPESMTASTELRQEKSAALSWWYALVTLISWVFFVLSL
jgi:NADPH:quinone reductase-like Zn-dependent oxidoreductase